jgi:hypothetical protein
MVRPRLSVAIMADPRRAALVPGIVDRLDRDPAVVWDRIRNRWDTGRRAWLAADPSATHHLVLQDDAIVCRDLVAGLEAALEYVPAEAIVTPFMGRRRPMVEKVENAIALADRTGAAFVVMRPLNWGLGIIVPTPAIGDMLRWCDRTAKWPNYDKRIGQYFIREPLWPTWCTWPSLVDHADVPSLAGHGPGRTAYRFVGRDRSALDLDWSAGYVVMSGTEMLDRHRRRRARLTRTAVPELAPGPPLAVARSVPRVR